MKLNRIKNQVQTKALGKSAKSGPTLDQLLSKYMNKRVVQHNRLAKQSKSSTKGSDICRGKGQLN
jgi:hypothetical protein